MEQGTLGKRIAYHRKRLGMTQEQLAQRVGVSAQAVSKWENNLSCPDITILPELASIFGISVDELLGRTPPKEERVHEAEVIKPEEKEHILDYTIGSAARSGCGSRSTSSPSARCFLLMRWENSMYPSGRSSGHPPCCWAV